MGTMLHWDYHRERQVDVVRASRRHVLGEIRPRDRRLPLVRLRPRRRTSVPARILWAA